MSSPVDDVWAWLSWPLWVRNLACVRAPSLGKASRQGQVLTGPCSAPGPVLGAEDRGEQGVVPSLTDRGSCLRGPVLWFNMCFRDSTWGKMCPSCTGSFLPVNFPPSTL